MKVKLTLTGLLFCCLLFVILQARQEFIKLPIGSQSKIQKVFSAATLDLNNSKQHFQAAPGNEIDFINPVLPKVVACGETALAVQCIRVGGDRCCKIKYWKNQFKHAAIHCIR